MSQEYQLTLQPPAYIRVETADQSHSARIDVYEAWRFIVEAEKQPSEEKRWGTIKDWLAKKLGCEASLLAENIARMFNEAIVKVGFTEQETIRKNLALIVCSQQPTPESQADTPAGQSS